MFITINCLQEKGNIFYFLSDKWVNKEFNRGRRGDELVALDKLLKDLGKKKSDIKGIAAVVGAGSFTATRIAVTTANTLGYALGIPTLPTNLVELKKLPNQFAKANLGQFISASYSAKPKIGPSKKIQRATPN